LVQSVNQLHLVQPPARDHLFIRLQEERKITELLHV